MFEIALLTASLSVIAVLAIFVGLSSILEAFYPGPSGSNDHPKIPPIKDYLYNGIGFLALGIVLVVGMIIY